VIRAPLLVLLVGVALASSAPAGAGSVTADDCLHDCDACNRACKSSDCIKRCTSLAAACCFGAGHEAPRDFCACGPPLRKP
jgi:hypothetical protein